MRGYSLRSAYPLARSSQSRRRLMLLYNMNATEQAPPASQDAWEDEPAGDGERTLDADELRRLYAQSFQTPAAAEEDVSDPRAFLDEIFQDSQTRNDALKAGRISESVLDDDEAAEVDAGLEDSILSASSGEESLIVSGGDEESRIFSMEDLREPAFEDLPGSAAAEDRKPHLPAWYVPNFKTIKRLLDADKPVTWMFAGESTASAADLAQGRRNFTDHFSDRIRTELGRMLDVVINTGNQGETCQSLLKNMEWRVLRFHPEAVSVMLGRKDAERGPAGRQPFQDSLEQIVQIVRESGAILVLHTPNRIDTAKAASLADLPNYVDIIRDVAGEYSIPLVDHWEHWRQQKPDAESLRTWLSADGVQPGVYGQREIAKLIFHRFEIFDPNSPICTARVP